MLDREGIFATFKNKSSTTRNPINLLMHTPGDLVMWMKMKGNLSNIRIIRFVLIFGNLWYFAVFM